MRKDKTCAVCQTKIKSQHIVCQEHWKLYLENKDEEWMQVLIETQRRQFEIDNEEVVLRTGRPLVQKRFYRKLTSDDIQQIEYYYKKGIGSVNISKILGVNARGIQHYIERKLKRRS
jgi:hypothetical protein